MSVVKQNRNKPAMHVILYGSKIKPTVHCTFNVCFEFVYCDNTRLFPLSPHHTIAVNRTL